MSCRHGDRPCRLAYSSQKNLFKPEPWRTGTLANQKTRKKMASKIDVCWPHCSPDKGFIFAEDRSQRHRGSLGCGQDLPELCPKAPYDQREVHDQLMILTCYLQNYTPCVDACMQGRDSSHCGKSEVLPNSLVHNHRMRTGRTGQTGHARLCWGMASLAGMSIMIE